MKRILLKKTETKKSPKIEHKIRLCTDTFLAPSIIGIMIFYILPFCVVIYYSLVDNPINHEFVFLDNFIKIFKNEAFHAAVKNTVLFSIIAVPLAVILSILLAVVLDNNIPFKSQFRTFFLCPMMVPVASIVLIWQVMFHYNGVINTIIGKIGILPVDWFKSSYSPFIIVILFLWKNLGYNMIIFMSAFGSIPKDLIEVALLENISGFKIFLHIKLRYITPSIFFVTIMSLINSFKVFREIYLLTGNYPYDSLYMLQHFMNNTFKSLDYQKLSSAAIIMAFVMVLIIGSLFGIENYLGKDLEG